MWRSLARVAALALLVFTGGVGVYNGMNEWRDVTNGLQVVVTGGVFGYGVLGLASIAAVLRRWPAARWLVAAWGARCDDGREPGSVRVWWPDVLLGVPRRLGRYRLIAAESGGHRFNAVRRCRRAVRSSRSSMSLQNAA